MHAVISFLWRSMAWDDQQACDGNSPEILLVVVQLESASEEENLQIQIVVKSLLQLVNDMEGASHSFLASWISHVKLG